MLGRVARGRSPLELLVLVAAAASVAHVFRADERHVAAQTPPIVYGDGSFFETQWTLSVVERNGGGTVEVERRLTGGDTGPYRRVRNVNEGPAYPPPQLVGLHRRVGILHDPATDGEIYCIDYSESHRMFAGNDDGQRFGPALWQNGKVYLHDMGVTGTPAGWQDASRSGLTSADFSELLPELWWDASSHPDFSPAGAPIQFGFFRSNSSTFTTQEVGIDNWRLELCSVPPTPFTPGTPSPSVTPGTGTSVTPATPTPSSTVPGATPSSLPPTVTATAPSATPTSNLSPPTQTRTPTLPGTDVPMVCPYLLGRVPAPVINFAQANPQTVRGWGELCNPSLPPGIWNGTRRYLRLQNMGARYHPLFNPVIFVCGCS
jgi:hypothetical protein